jgi:O-antigen ligase
LYWKIGLSIIKKSIIVGKGTGSAKKAYKDYYKEHLTVLKLKNQRLAHNQFLTQLINLGVFGFFVWFLILLIPSLRLIKKERPLFLSFLCSMFIALFSDDMLERQAGVTIFATIFYLFIFTSNNKELTGLFLLKKNSE